MHASCQNRVFSCLEFKKGLSVIGVHQELSQVVGGRRRRKIKRMSYDKMRMRKEFESSILKQRNGRGDDGVMK